MIPNNLLDQMTNSFSIERNGSIVGEAKGLFCSSKYPNTIQIIENADIKDGDWLIHTATGKRCFAKNARPVTDVTGNTCHWMVEYTNELEYQRNTNTSNIHIQNVNGPSIIGNQQNAIINAGASLDEIKGLISQVLEQDKPEFEELTNELERIENSNHPVLIEGMLGKFKDFLNKYPDLILTLGRWAVKLLVGN